MTSTVSQARNPDGLQQAEHQSKTLLIVEASWHSDAEKAGSWERV
jgi:hypothetical protein